MRQYTFQVIDKKTGQVDHVRATAKNPEIARNALDNAVRDIEDRVAVGRLECL